MRVWCVSTGIKKSEALTCKNYPHQELDSFYKPFPLIGNLHEAFILVSNTLKPPNKGHIGDGPFAPCREVILFSEVFF